MSALFHHSLPLRLSLALVVSLSSHALSNHLLAEVEAVGDETLNATIRQAVLDGLKEKYEDEDDWGRTTKVIKGYKIRGQGLKLRAEKRTKQVNDGLWQRYIVTLVDPANNFQLRLENARIAGPGQFAFTLFLRAKLHGEAHIERWRLGVKMLNTSADAEAMVEARIDCTLAIRVEAKNLSPAVILEPKVEAIRLDLLDLDVQRVSHLDGRTVHEIGDSFTPVVARELHRREAKIVTKANASIAKRQDRLRFSLDEFVSSGWSKFQAKLAQKQPAPDAPQAQ